MENKYYISKDNKKCGIIRPTTPQNKLEEWEAYVVSKTPNKTTGERNKGYRDIDEESLKEYWDEVLMMDFYIFLDKRMTELINTIK